MNKDSVKIEAGSGSVLVSVSFASTRKDSPGISGISTGMLALTRITGCPSGEDLTKLDRLCDGKIARQEEEDGFTGHQGQSLLVDCRQTESRADWVLLLGQGSVAGFDGRTVCNLLASAVERAASCRVSKLTLVIMPYRASQDKLTLAGLAAIIRCRLQRLLEQDLCGSLAEIELYVTPQAGRHVSRGLRVTCSHCSECPFGRSRQ